MKLHLISLGCAKNQVDSELMLGRLKQAGWSITEQPEKAESIIVNTCSFIEPAVDESIDTILEAAKFKTQGVCRQLIVAGCLPQRYREELVTALPEVDAFLGTGAYDQIVQILEKKKTGGRCILPDPDTIGLQRHNDLRILGTSYLSYLKIAEGCNRRCTYCIIPKLRGRQRSRPLEDIVKETRDLVKSGVNELVLVAQDTTSYGNDLNPPVDFDRLINRISAIAENTRIRFLYGHPESLDESVMRTVAMQRNICSYFDIPIQHVSDRILKQMGRNYTQKDLNRLFDRIRSIVPEAALRTTVIVGFPGEKEDDFKQLINFIKSVQFDHLGVFVYSDSKDLPSHTLAGHVPKNMAEKRRDILMRCQAKISLNNNQKHINKTYAVMVEEKIEKNQYIGRTVFQAPEVDGLTYVHSEKLRIGAFYNIKIVGALEYDLAGEIV